MGIIDDKRKALDEKEPFTDNEKVSYQERDLQFIRDIQLKKGISKTAAKKEFNKYLNSSDNSKKKLSLRKEIRNMLQASSPPSHAPPIEITEQKHKRPKVKKPRKKIVKKKGINKKQPQKIKEAIKNTKSPKVVKRLQSASKKYPNATPYELRHGVNSKASQEYRLRHGKGLNYEN